MLGTWRATWLATMRRWPVFFVACMALAGACDDVDSSNIQRWKGTQKGPRKLESALANHGVPPRLRAEAGLALIEIGKADAAEQTLAGLAPADRSAVAAELIPLLAGVLQAGSVTQARDARDGLFALRTQLAATDQAKIAEIDAVLLPALGKELRAGRVAGGRYSIERILQTIGPAAAPTLLQVLEDPAAPYIGVVELLSKVSDADVRERASQVLVRRAAGMPSIPPQMWRALGLLGGKAATEFLQNKVEKGHESDAVLAAQALQNGPRNPALVPFAMRIAGDQRANRAVRDEMFGLLEYVGTPEAVEGAIRVIASDPDPVVRYRAYEAAVAAGKEGAIQVALETFPMTASYKREDVVDFLVKDIQKVGIAARPAIVKALASRSPLARMTAVLAFEAVGTAADAPEVQKLEGDRATVRGFPPGATVGREAARIAGILQTRADGGKP
jgi:hypothetical protein